MRQKVSRQRQEDAQRSHPVGSRLALTEYDLRLSMN